MNTSRTLGFGSITHALSTILPAGPKSLFTGFSQCGRRTTFWRSCLPQAFFALLMPEMRSIYLDYNATTPLDPDVRAAMEPFFAEVWGNPSSVHHIGRKARAMLDELRDRSSIVLGCKPSELVFTSGGTEANNLAIFGTARLLRDKGRHLITSTIEHHAVLHCFDYLQKHEGFKVTRLPADSNGLVNPEDLQAALRDDTVLVSIMAANNETGTIQFVSECGELCQKRGILFHTDAAQWFGKEEFHEIGQFNADLVSICAHKFHGPRGSGALYIKSPGESVAQIDRRGGFHGTRHFSWPFHPALGKHRFLYRY